MLNLNLVRLSAVNYIQILPTLFITRHNIYRCPQVNGSLLPASVISVYCTYLCYSALSSEPRDFECNGLHNHSKAVSTGSLTLGLITTVLSVVYSAVRAGSSTTFISPPSSPRAGQYAVSHFVFIQIYSLKFDLDSHSIFNDSILTIQSLTYILHDNQILLFSLPSKERCCASSMDKIET